MKEPKKRPGDEGLVWKELKTEHLIRDEWIDLRRSVYEMPDGRVFEPWYTYTRRDYAVIVAMTEDWRVVTVRQFRQGVRRLTTEFPAGGLEDAEKEDPEGALRAAVRELREETGYESSEWTHLLTVPDNATISDNVGHLFLAQNCRRVSGQDLDITEYLKPLLLTPEELEEAVQSGEFAQAVHILAWELAKKKM